MTSKVYQEIIKKLKSFDSNYKDMEFLAGKLSEIINISHKESPYLLLNKIGGEVKIKNDNFTQLDFKSKNNLTVFISQFQSLARDNLDIMQQIGFFIINDLYPNLTTKELTYLSIRFAYSFLMPKHLFESIYFNVNNNVKKIMKIDCIIISIMFLYHLLDYELNN